MSRKFVAWPALPLCVFLIFIGMRVPNLASLHTAPKPRPRAVIESVSKAPQDATAKEILALEISQAVPATAQLQAYPAAAFQLFSHYRSITLPLNGARAPPFFAS